MAEVLLFHHAQGLTIGCLTFAAGLHDAGHVVHAPDLYEGKTFAELADGIAHAEEIGFEEIVARGRLAAEGLPEEIVYAGFSLGVLPAQALAQTRPGAKGVLALHSAVRPAELGSPWPDGLPLQIHTAEDDPHGDVEVAHELARTIPTAELFLYAGDRHLFTDSSLPDYDRHAATLLGRRVLTYLESLTPVD